MPKEQFHQKSEQEKELDNLRNDVGILTNHINVVNFLENEDTIKPFPKGVKSAESLLEDDTDVEEM